MNKLISGALTFLGALLFVLAMSFVIGIIVAYPLMWLWNKLLPELFGLPTISFWQAFGIYFLCGLLFRSTHTTNNK